VKQLKKGTFISQEKYVRDMLKKFEMNKAKTAKTPMPNNGQLGLGENDKAIDQKVHRSMFGSLLSLRTSRPDIMLRVGTCAHFQSLIPKTWIDARVTYSCI
jgi:hypothetical protein